MAAFRLKIIVLAGKFEFEVIIRFVNYRWMGRCFSFLLLEAKV